LFNLSALQAIVAGIEAVTDNSSVSLAIPGRCEVIDEGQPFSVIVDVASTPETLARLLDAVKEAGAKRVFLVFGCEGDGNRQLREQMGEVAHFKVRRARRRDGRMRPRQQP
jgi:UDP-N-acetylmuramyl tripeptide synthase